MRRIITPNFAHSELSYALDKTSAQVMVKEYEELLSAADSAYSPKEDMIYIITRQHNKGDTLYSQTAISLKNDFVLNFPKQNKLPRMFINVEEDVLEVVSRITKNLVFL